jgi:16S rRNA (guanine527-N7)-methyltransferase
MKNIDLITKYFPDLTAKQIDQFAQLEEVYNLWNAKINVISRKDIDQLYLKHILHSLAIAKFVNFNPGTNVVDIGTGGGFPGIPLAIMFPESEFLLVDSIGKKITVVNEVIKALDLKNVKGIQARLEELKEKPDFYVTRAVAPFAELIKWIKKGINSKKQKNQIKNGLIALKGGDLGEELKNYPNSLTVPISDYFEEEFFEQKFLIYNRIK